MYCGNIYKRVLGYLDTILKTMFSYLPFDCNPFFGNTIESDVSVITDQKYDELVPLKPNV